MLDTQLIRQRALEKARLKSDEELGIRGVIRSSGCAVRKIEVVTRHEGILMKGETGKYESRTESADSGSDVDGEYESRTENDLFIDGEGSGLMQKLLILDEFDQDYELSKARGKNRILKLKHVYIP